MAVCFVVYAGDEIRRILLESLLPLIKYFAAKTVQDKKQKSAKMLPPLPVDVALAEYDVFDDYLEMVIQFGVRKLIRSLVIVLKSYIYAYVYINL